MFDIHQNLSVMDSNSRGKREIERNYFMQETKSLRSFSSNNEYLYAMKEDLAEWLAGLHNVAIDAENLFEVLNTGVLLCRHANHVSAEF